MGKIKTLIIILILFYGAFPLLVTAPSFENGMESEPTKTILLIPPGYDEHGRLVYPPKIEPTPPPPGGDTLQQLMMIHRCMTNNSEIMNFIRTCGLKEIKPVPINRTHYLVYLIPEEDIPVKMIFLEHRIENRVIWAKLIDINETVPFKIPDPYDDFFNVYPEAKQNDSIVSFINTYKPCSWKEVLPYLNSNSSFVYLIADKNEDFYELIYLKQGGDIKWVKILNGSELAVNKKEALRIVAKKMNSSMSATDIHIVLNKNLRPIWVISYMAGPFVTVYYVATDDGKFNDNFASAKIDGSQELVGKVSNFVKGQDAIILDEGAIKESSYVIPVSGEDLTETLVGNADNRKFMYQIPGFTGVFVLLTIIVLIRIRKTQ